MSAGKPATKPVVIVTGASGFLGRAIIDSLAAKFDVIGFDHQQPAQAPSNAEFIGIDVTADASVKAALARVRASRGAKIASVIHLAAFFDLSGDADPRYEAVTVHGSDRLIEALKAFDVEQFVFMSTLLAHAPSGHERRIDEDSPLDDRFPYRASKIRTEELLREQHGKIPLVILRPAGIYDDHCHATFLAHQIARIHQRQMTSRVYPGDLQAGQPLLHLDDLCDALRRVVERRHDLPEETTLLLGESEVLSFGEIQKIAGNLIHDEDWQTRSIPAAMAASGAWLQDKVLDEDPFIRPWMVEISSDHYQIDTGRAAALLGWKARRSLRQTLPKMIAALKDDPVGWYETNNLNAANAAAEAVDREAKKKEADTGHEDQGHDEDHGGMAEHMQQMRDGHFSLLWVHWLNILLGAWLAISPFAFGSFGASEFSDAVWAVTADRGLADPGLRSALLGRSDVISGLLIMLFGALSLSPRFSWAQWANAAMGCWLLFAPLIFWAPDAASYTNDTFVGALVIAFAILVPMMPGMSMAGMMDQSDLPPGWSYCPSTYLQRLPIIALGAFGLLLARVLTAYQLGHIDGVWEPFFATLAPENGTEKIITSDVSKAWPVADGGLGAVAYVFEVLMGVMGDRRRWRTMPWMVAMFGIVVVPLGVVSIYFIVIQPIVIGTWCTLCLITAAAMLVMIPYSLDELVAMGQYLVQSTRRGEPFWRTFFKGGAQPVPAAAASGARDQHAGAAAPLPAALASAVRGVNLPWTLVVSSLLGVGLMFTRVFFDSVPPMADSDHFAGAMVLTFAVMAMAEVGRALRFVNVGVGLWLIVAPWLLAGGSDVANAAGVLIGVAVIALSLPRGKRSSEHYGRWDRLVV
ncbi:MAG: NAD-dependent epimerase/dehydratase family protein [Propionivibrio sp.]